MSKLVYWLIIIGAYLVYYVIKSLISNHSDVKGTPIGGEVFPGIDIYNQTDSDTTDEYSGGTKTESINRKVTKRATVKEKPHKTVPVTQEATDIRDEKAGISLKSRSEAKRAFIYAEILKRKY